jgi:hypothetical protein
MGTAATDVALFSAGRHDRAPGRFLRPPDSKKQPSPPGPCSDRHVVEREDTGSAVWQASLNPWTRSILNYGSE